MSKGKVHLGIWYTHPNESDTQGESGLLCGKEYDDPRVTEYENLVTCRKCRSIIDRDNKQS